MPIGSKFDDFLKEEGTFESVSAGARAKASTRGNLRTPPQVATLDCTHGKMMQEHPVQALNKVEQDEAGRAAGATGHLRLKRPVGPSA